ncbi:unnamed protein product [Prunus armeniaca]
MLGELAVHREIILGELAVHTKILKRQMGTGKLAIHLCSTHKYLKPIVNRETGQLPMQSNRAGGLGIFARHLCNKYRYTQISKANCEQGNLPATSSVITGRWMGKSCSKN